MELVVAEQVSDLGPLVREDRVVFEIVDDIVGGEKRQIHVQTAVRADLPPEIRMQVLDRRVDVILDLHVRDRHDELADDFQHLHLDVALEADHVHGVGLPEQGFGIVAEGLLNGLVRALDDLVDHLLERADDAPVADAELAFLDVFVLFPGDEQRVVLGRRRQVADLEIADHFDLARGLFECTC
ncbi:MAG: hypothetical protein BWY66_01190 [bacterium ADurb.Bin374]|nr:MAG: hypothetical protein BWY66_01190 [bacterium ADurb.Bin374]